MSYQPPNQGPQHQSPYQPQTPTWGAAQPGAMQPGAGQPGMGQPGGMPPGGYVPPPKKKNNTCLILALVFGGIGGFCTLCTCGFVFLGLYSQELQVRPQDEAVLVTAADISQFVGDFVPNSSREKITRNKHLDGSVELSYEYDDTNNEEAPYISYTVFTEASESDAATEFDTLWAATELGMKIGGGSSVSVSERNDIFTWGDKSRFGIMTVDGQPAGNLFVGRQGKFVVVFIIANIYFEDDAFADLMMPYLDGLRTYDGTGE